jgi:hypothetical protein
MPFTKIPPPPPSFEMGDLVEFRDNDDFIVRGRVRSIMEGKQEQTLHVRSASGQRYTGTSTDPELKKISSSLWLNFLYSVLDYNSERKTGGH